MVKYATKAEKKSDSLTNLFTSVMSHARQDDDPTSKLRSLMLKTIGCNRDIGQSEVCRLILSEPLYHTTFQFVNQSLDFGNRQINIGSNNDEESAFVKTMLDFF